MIRSFTAASAVATVFVALSPAAGAGPAPVQLAQMNAAPKIQPKIQPAPPPNLARPPVITPRIDTSRLAGERDDGQDDDDDGKDTAGNPEQIPQETATGAVPEAPAAARRTAPPIARLTRAPLPQARPDLFGGIDPKDLIDARGAAEAREAAEAAATAGVGVERSDLSGLGIPGADDDGVDPDDPRLGGLTPEEYKERFGLGGATREEIAHGLATGFNDLGNRGVDSPAGNVAAGVRPDPTTIPRGDLASNRGWDTVYLRPTFFLNRTEDSGWQPRTGASGEVRTITEFNSANIRTRTTTHVIYENGSKSTSVSEHDVEGNETYRHYEHRDKDGNIIAEEETGTPRESAEGVAELQTPESASGGVGGCLPSDGSAACNELRRLQREGNSPGALLDGSALVNPGDADAGNTGSGPRLIMGEDDLLGNPDPHRTEGGMDAPSARAIDGGKLVNPPDPNE